VGIADDRDACFFGLLIRKGDFLPKGFWQDAERAKDTQMALWQNMLALSSPKREGIFFIPVLLLSLTLPLRALHSGPASRDRVAAPRMRID
jgi:hypothetical protein